jgi:membrane protein
MTVPVIPKMPLVFRLLRRTVTEWSADNATRWSASLAFYTLLSLAPLLVVMVSIAGFVYGSEAAQGELARGLRNLVSPAVNPAIQILLATPHERATGLIAAVFGGLTLFFGASSVLTELRDALNAIWRLPVNRESSKVADFFRFAKERMVSFVVILGCGMLLLVSLALTSWIGALGTIFGWRILTSSPFFSFFVWSISFLVIAFVFSAIYKVIPEVDLSWRDVTVGGTATALLFMTGKQIISIYVGRTGLGSAYGAAGSLIVVLVWVYYSAQVFFLGAEFTKVYAETFGCRVGENRSGGIDHILSHDPVTSVSHRASQTR